MTTEKRSDDFLREIGRIHQRMGTIMLADEDLIMLLAEEISLTTTREEKQYSSGKDP